MMRKLTALLFTSALAFGVFSHSTASADEPENLKVLDKKLGKKVSKGMKNLSKGLGVKCVACHVKGKFESDEVPNKGKARDFLKVAIHSQDKAKRAEALTALLKELKIEKAKDEPKIWKAVDGWMTKGGPAK